MAKPDKLEQTAHVHPEEFQATKGTYDFLAALPDGRLGNKITKHNVWVQPAEDESGVSVTMRIRYQRPYLFPYDMYFFTIDQQDLARNLQAQRVESPQEPKTQLRPRFATVMQDLYDARRIDAAKRRK